MKKRRSIILTAVLLATITGNLNGTAIVKATEFGDYTEKISFSSCFMGADNDAYKNNDMYSMIAEKFNVDMDFISLSWDNWSEKNRIWLNSGDMPDMLFWDFNAGEFAEYVEQEQIKPLPEGWEERYPNLAASVEKSGIGEYLRKIGNGTLYGVPRTTNVFAESAELPDHFALIYRKDWAEAVGMEIGDVISFEDFLTLASAFVEQDPGNNGEGNTIGITGDADRTSKIFLETYNSDFNRFYLDEDNTYKHGIMDAETLEGVKRMWQALEDGQIDINFFSNKVEDAANKFHAGQAGMYTENVIPNALNNIANNFKAANPDLNPEECIGVCMVTGPDGLTHGYVADNFWTCTLFNPDMDDATMERILAIMDYFASEEGIMTANLGLEGTDWKVENDEIVITRPVDESGAFKAVADLYPCAAWFKYFSVCGDGYSYIDPTIPTWIHKLADDIPNKKLKAGIDIAERDLYLAFFTGEEYAMYDVQTTSVATEVVLEAESLEEVETLWNQKLDEIEDKTNRVLEELNAGLAQ